jgi:Tfp pilus assembly pilus retraction ATPase PilT
VRNHDGHSAISANIRTNDIKAIEGALVDQSYGNLSLDAHLAQLIRQGLITKRHALSVCSSPDMLGQLLGQQTSEGTRR